MNILESISDFFKLVLAFFALMGSFFLARFLFDLVGMPDVLGTILAIVAGFGGFIFVLGPISIWMNDLISKIH